MDIAQPAEDKDLPDFIRRLERAKDAATAKHYGEAIGICSDIIDLRPDFAGAYAFRGIIEAYRGNFAEGVLLLEKALELSPNHARWLTSLSGLYRTLYRFDDALDAANKAAHFAPNDAEALNSLAKVLVDRGELDDAATFFMSALTRDTQCAEAHLGLSQVFLSRGQFAPGWIEYEWRNQLDQAKSGMPKMVTAPWSGIPIRGYPLLLIGDQGFGDAIHFLRYVPLVAERCDHIIVACSPELIPLFRSMPNIREFYSRWDEVPSHLAHCLLSSLPSIFRTDLSNLPPGPPYLRPDEETVAKWQAKLSPVKQSGKLLVGVVWAGRSSHPNDIRRSLSLATLEPLARVAGVQLISLQKPVPDQDSRLFGDIFSEDWSGDLVDFNETAGLIAGLDLVISVDSAVCHLAGSLACPVWVLMPTPADWRWMLDREDTPWYPSMRLFRQSQAGDWDNVVERVQGELRAALNGRSLNLSELLFSTNGADEG